MSQYVAKKEAAEIIGVSLPTLNRLIKSGRLPATKLGACVRIAEASIQAMMEAHRINPMASNNNNSKEGV